MRGRSAGRGPGRAGGASSRPSGCRARTSRRPARPRRRRPSRRRRRPRRSRPCSCRRTGPPTIPARSSSSSTPMWANARAPPPASTSPSERPASRRTSGAIARARSGAGPVHRGRPSVPPPRRRAGRRSCRRAPPGRRPRRGGAAPAAAPRCRRPARAGPRSAGRTAAQSGSSPSAHEQHRVRRPARPGRARRAQPGRGRRPCGSGAARSSSVAADGVGGRARVQPDDGDHRRAPGRRRGRRDLLQPSGQPGRPGRRTGRRRRRRRRRRRSSRTSTLSRTARTVAERGAPVSSPSSPSTAPRAQLGEHRPCSHHLQPPAGQHEQRVRRLALGEGGVPRCDRHLGRPLLQPPPSGRREPGEQRAARRSPAASPRPACVGPSGQAGRPCSAQRRRR